MARLFIVGGSDAGISAALRARELTTDWQVTVAVADRDPNYSICGIPYFLSKEVPEAGNLAHRKAPEHPGHGGWSCFWIIESTILIRQHIK
jgi:NADPH-dependent 2,4-dienoyl-CoA reductase/sulfur reductase-like enzyme